MAGNTIRNNILVSYDGPTFHTEKIADVTGSVIENNIIWKRTDGAWPKDHQIVRAEDTDGSHTSSSPDGATYFWYYWDIDGLNGLADASNNLLADPQFADVSWDYYLSPEHFDFTVQATSPAIDHAAGAEGPSDDLRGELRTGELDAGCYLL